MIAFVDQAVRGSNWHSSDELDKLCAKLEAMASDDETPLFRLWLERYPDLAPDLRISYRQGHSSSFFQAGWVSAIYPAV